MDKTFILSDGTTNSYGFQIDMSKLKLNRFKSNPVMLYNHEQLVGKWDNIRLEDGSLVAEPSFMEDESEGHALKIKNRVEKGFVKGASLGITILGVEKASGLPPKVEAEVFECSVCDIPSNSNAIVLYTKEGVKLEGKAFDLAVQTITTNKINTDMKLNLDSYKALGLKSNADATAVDTAIVALSKERDTYKEQMALHKQEKVSTLIETALSEGKFLADKKEQFTELANQNFDLAKLTIEALPKKETLAGKELLSTSKSEDRDSWTFADWRQKDTKGLLAIKSEDPNRYAELLKK